MEVLVTMGVAPEEAQSPVGREQARQWFIPLHKFSLLRLSGKQSRLVL